MYTNEEMEAILAPLKEIAANEGYNGNLVSFYAQRRFDETLTITLIVFNICYQTPPGIRKKLRIIYMIDSAQPAYETLVETHPAMYKYSDAIWMEHWSKKSMIAVATKIVKYV